MEGFTSHHSLFRVDAYIIYEHLLRELRGVVGRARPGAADRHIQNDEEGMVEFPGASGGPLRLSDRLVEIGIDKKADGARLPLDCVNMKVVSEILPGG